MLSTEDSKQLNMFNSALYTIEEEKMTRHIETYYSCRQHAFFSHFIILMYKFFNYYLLPALEELFELMRRLGTFHVLVYERLDKI